MTRTWLLFLGIAAVGFAVLVALAGGIAGPRTRAPEPVVETPQTPDGRALDMSEYIPGVSIRRGLNLSWTYPWETVDWTDPATGTTVRLTSLNKWRFHAESFDPHESAETKSGLFRQVDVWTYRLPKTLEEARAAERGDADAIEKLLKLHITADKALAETLSRRLNPTGSTPKETAFVGEIQLLGKVVIEDLEQGLRVEGSDVTILPDSHRATGTGQFKVTHATYVIEGRDLELQHEGEGASAVQRDRVEIKRDVRMFLSGKMEGGKGLAIDLEATEDCPCELRGAGGAVVIRESTATADRLHVRMRSRMLASQTGGRGIEADRMELIARRTADAARGRDEPGKGWVLESFEADGDVVANYHGQNDQGDPFLASMRAGHLVHESLDGGRTFLTTLRRDPDIQVIGRIPLEGIESSDGTLRLRCRDEARIAPAPATDVPPGEAPEHYRQVTLTGAARVERDEAGTTLQRDLLEGDEITMLLVTRERPAPAAAGGPRNDTLAVSFSASGSVRLGGTRLSGTTDHLRATGLDTEKPRLTATAHDGRTSTFAFTDLAHLGGPFGMGSAPAGGDPEATPEGGRGEPSDAPRAQWLLDRFLARGSVDASFALAGAAFGLPAHLQGESVAYDRISDVARLQSGSAGPARVEFLGIDGVPRDVFEAGHIEVERTRGTMRAGGGVFSRVFPEDLNRISGGGLSKVPRGAPQSIALTAEGTIELRMDRRGTGPTPSEGAEQRLLVEGPLRLEMRSTNGAIDRLRADALEAVMVRAVRSPEPTPSSVTARVAPGARTPGERAPRPGVRRGSGRPWELRASDLSLTFTGNDVTTFEASGSVTVESDEGIVRGDILTYDARTRTLGVRMRGAGSATAIFGEGTAKNRVASPEIAVALGERGPGSVRARGPVHATLYRVDPKTPGRLERYTVLSSGDVEIDETRIVTQSRAPGAAHKPQVQSASRTSPSGPWEDAWELWADRLRVSGRSLLGGDGAVVERLEAAGADTTFVARGTRSDLSIWADRFEFDMRTNLVTVIGTAEVPALLEYGKEGEPKQTVEYPRAVFDLEKGTFVGGEAFRGIIRREDR